MDFSAPRPRRPAEAILPMINVVFLLLIFFLMTARITPAAPFVVEPPKAPADTPSEGAHILFLSASGVLYYQGHEGDAIWAHLGDDPLTLRADAGVGGDVFARTLSRLRAAGVDSVTLAVTP